jgi:hypothetical protein
VTPVAVFAYDRPDHLQRTLTSLMSCEGFAESPVTIFIDGPRTPERAESVLAVQQVARLTLGSAADIRISPNNMGLSQSITNGVAELLAKYGRVIVVEDDLELATGFLRYMVTALDRYAGAENIYQISGHMFDVPTFSEPDRAILLPVTTTWGWATWSRAWSRYDPKATGWKQLLTDQALRRRFDLGGAYPFSWLMERQACGLSFRPREWLCFHQSRWCEI